jgi:hypothetical protein
MGYNLARKIPPKNQQPPKPKQKPPKPTFQEVARRLVNEEAEKRRKKIDAEQAAKMKAEEDATYALMYGPNWESRDDLPDNVSAPPEQRKLSIVPPPSSVEEDLEIDLDEISTPSFEPTKKGRKGR